MSPVTSQVDSTHSVVVTITDDGYGNLTFSHSTTSAGSSDKASMYVFDLDSLNSNGYFSLPANGHKYWVVPFDTTQPLSQIANGSGGSGNCGCICRSPTGYHDTGNDGHCDMTVTSTNGSTGTYRCDKNGTCYSCSLDTIAQMIHHGNGIIIDAVSVTYKGTTYY